jgi:hypothetical protein
LTDALREGVCRCAAAAGGLRAAVLDLGLLHPGREVPRSVGIQESGGSVTVPTAAAGVVTVSIGCAAVVPEAHTEYAELVAMVDRALYFAWSTGRNRVCIADEPQQWDAGSAMRKLRARIETYRREFSRNRLA